MAPKLVQNRSKIGPKSVKIQVCVSDAFGIEKWTPKARKEPHSGDPFGDHFCIKIEKIEKMVSKVDVEIEAEIDAEKVSKMMPKRPQREGKIIKKLLVFKAFLDFRPFQKKCQNCCQNDAKMDSKWVQNRSDIRKKRKKTPCKK